MSKTTETVSVDVLVNNLLNIIHSPKIQKKLREANKDADEDGEDDLDNSEKKMLDQCFMFPQFTLKGNSLKPNTNLYWYEENAASLSKDDLVSLWLLSTFEFENIYASSVLLALHGIVAMEGVDLIYEKEKIVDMSIIQAELRDPISIIFCNSEEKRIQTKQNHVMLLLNCEKKDFIVDFIPFWRYSTKQTTNQNSNQLPAEKCVFSTHNYPLSQIYEISKTDTNLYFPFKIKSKSPLVKVLKEFYEDVQLLENEQQQMPSTIEELEKPTTESKTEKVTTSFLSQVLQVNVFKEHCIAYITELILYEEQKKKK